MPRRHFVKRHQNRPAPGNAASTNAIPLYPRRTPDDFKPLAIKSGKLKVAGAVYDLATGKVQMI
jgi:hypothetical protein